MTDELERGWYRDPADASRGRWWDGERWTERIIFADKRQETDDNNPAAPPTAGDRVRKTSDLRQPTEGAARSAGTAWRNLGAVFAVLILLGSLVIWVVTDSFVIAAGAGVSSLIPVLPYFALATLMDMVADLGERREAT